MGPTVNVLYTCRKCGLIDKSVPVAERADGQDIADWMMVVQIALSADHDRISPRCHIVKFTNCKIPLAHGDDVAIGKADRH